MSRARSPWSAGRRWAAAARATPRSRSATPWPPASTSSEPYRFTAADVAAFRDAYPSGPPARLIDGEMVSWYGSRAIPGLDYLERFAAAGPDMVGREGLQAEDRAARPPRANG